MMRERPLGEVFRYNDVYLRVKSLYASAENCQNCHCGIIGECNTDFRKEIAGICSSLRNDGIPVIFRRVKIPKYHMKEIDV